MIKRNILECMTLVGKAPSHYEGAKTYVSTGAVDCDHIDYKQTEQVTYDNRPSRANLSVTSGDILFAKMCGTKKTLRINDVMAKYLFSTGFCAVRANESVMIADLLYHLLSSEQFLTQKDQNSSGATQKAITNTGLKKITIQVPDLEEQRVLAAKLDCIEQMMAKRRIQIEYFDQLVKSRFIEMFGDPMTNPYNLPKVILGSVLTIEPQNGLYKPQFDYVSDGTGVPILRIDSFYEGKVSNLSSLKRLICSEIELKRYSLYENDIVINRVNSIEYLGKCGLIQGLVENTVFESNMMRLHVDEHKFHPVYITKLLCSEFIYQQILRRAKKAVNQASINQKDVQSFVVYMPPIEQQDQFAAFVKQTDKSKLAIQESLKRLEILKKSLMQKYFG